MKTDSVYKTPAFAAATKAAVDTLNLDNPPLAQAEVSALPKNVQSELASLSSRFDNGDGGAAIYRESVNYGGKAYPVLVVQAGDDTGSAWKAYSDSNPAVYITQEVNSESE
jgi:hypothetical protein